MYDLLIKNGTLVTKDGMFQADVAVKNEKYAAFVKQGEDIAAQRTIDAAGMLVFPGIIDCHAHLNEPGYEYREDFETGTRAAASAGCTCLIDMPLNNRPALTDKEAFACKKERALQKSYIDFALWGGIVGAYDENGMRTPANLDKLTELQECQVAAFKAFTCPNGPEFPAVSMGEVRRAMEILKPYHALLGFHCEEYGQVLFRTKERRQKEGRTADEKIQDFLEAHDVWTEYMAVENILTLVRATGCRAHICHVSHPYTAERIREAIREGLPVTAETCPHYLGMTEKDLFQKGAAAKCTPPLRKAEDVEKLWEYVLDGTLSCIGSDHSPAADNEKDNAKLDIWEAWGGFNSIQCFLPYMYELAVNRRKLSPSLLAKTMCYAPAKIFGLYGRKGDFKPGFDADFVIFDPKKKWKCNEKELYTKGHVSCFHGVEGTGSAAYTIVRGRVVAQDGKYLAAEKGTGEFIPSFSIPQ